MSKEIHCFKVLHVLPSCFLEGFVSLYSFLSTWECLCIGPVMALWWIPRITFMTFTVVFVLRKPIPAPGAHLLIGGETSSPKSAVVVSHSFFHSNVLLPRFLKIWIPASPIPCPRSIAFSIMQAWGQELVVGPKHETMSHPNRLGFRVQLNSLLGTEGVQSSWWIIQQNYDMLERVCLGRSGDESGLGSRDKLEETSYVIIREIPKICTESRVRLA